MARILLYVLPLALAIYALVDFATDDDVERTSVPKLAWIFIIIVLPIAGPLAWLVVAKIARPRRTARQPGTWGRGPASRYSRPAPRQPMRPDDDQEFLRHWAADQTLREHERRQREAAEGAEGNGAADSGDQPPPAGPGPNSNGPS
ncbi:MAG: PLD nuclease N-terminal domain-containing protein [Bifidobacteriaceae bacterium]|jgi:hypothetical protein|nr:PLD nuclease N-terminal domain-containing protein [Bifidobacteriaceae bacterium]